MTAYLDFHMISHSASTSTSGIIDIIYIPDITCILDFKITKEGRKLVANLDKNQLAFNLFV